MAWLCWGRRGRSSFKQLLVLLLLVYVGGFLYFTLSSSSARHAASRMDLSLIDDIIKGRWSRGSRSGVRYVSPDCRPRSKLAFIKCMKCATETLGTVFRRHAYLNNLSVVLPVERRIYLGWPFPLTPLDYRPSSRGYSLLMEHSIYNASVMRRLMAPGTVFLTMIREPLDLFVSTLHYFNVFRLAQAPLTQGTEAVQEYLRHLHRYEDVYRSHAAAPQRYCIPDGFSVTRNPLAHCLGMPLGFPAGRPNITGEPDAVRRYIERLDSEFLLVMLVEHFQESLVLMKRLLCWSLKDVLYHSSNQGAYRHNLTGATLTPQDRQLHREWSGVDYVLYDHFNATFWRKVREQGEGFSQEVDYFREVQRQVTSFCRKVSPYGDSVINFPSSAWSPPFSFSTADCQLMVSPLLNMLKERYQKQEPGYANFSTATVPRKFVPLC